MNDETPKSRWQRYQITALLVLAAVLGALLIGGIAYQHGSLSRRAEVYFIADDVTGLAPGTTVRMSGFRIGKISEMELQEDLNVKVVLVIETEPFSRLRADARANVIREQLKPAAIDLRAGSSPTLLSAGDPRVAFGRRGTLTEIAEDLRVRLAPILDDVKQLTGVARERRADIDALLRNAHDVSRELAGAAIEMRALTAELRQRAGRIGAQSEATMAEVNRSVVRTGGLIGQAEKSLDAVNAKLPGMLLKAESALGNLDAVLRDSRTISAAAASSVPAMLNNVSPMIDDSREMMRGVRQSWPMRGMLPAPAPALLPIESHDSAALREPVIR